MLMRLHDRATVIDRTLRSGWWTIQELADLAQCTRQYARWHVQMVGLSTVLFKRKRRHVKMKPMEYRRFPRAINVTAIEKQPEGGIQVWIKART